SSQIFESNLPNVQLCSPYFMINEKKKLSINYPSFDYKVNSIAIDPRLSATLFLCLSHKAIHSQGK
ncbi:hypothetical protein, partial [Iodobacter sp. BJB302]|uniref:hypothetical protein n=1 Tax=Iodobacter sp. BJB302 TaxID=1506510 RepID=UPI001C55823B